MITPPLPADNPDSGICWQRWSATSELQLARRDRPILLFVADPEPTVFMSLRAIFQAMPANARLCELLRVDFSALYVETESMPEELGVFGAGSRYHIAILSPHGLNPMIVFDVVRGDPSAIVAEIVAVLERLLPVWR